jgi:FPC/CPF motif-containing protein YcgG
MGGTMDDGRGVTNPFDCAAARRHSNYCVPDGASLLGPGAMVPSSLTTLVHEGVRALVLSRQYSCIAARSALRHNAYRFALYPPLGSSDSALSLAFDLWTFVRDAPSLDSPFATFIASFEGPVLADEAAFEGLLWQTLQQLHDLDAVHHAWDTSVSADAASRDFAFSFAGTAFFIVGLHAAASRAARRFAWPTLVFNAHRQFEQLKTSGQYARFQQVIRAGERSLQGDVNPMLADFGERSEAAQYSGRHVESDWRCPFRPHPQPRDDGSAP